MKKYVKKGLSVILSVAMFAAMLPMAGLANEAKAADAEVKDVNLSTYGWKNPGTPERLTDEWAGGEASYVYFGEYVQNDTTGGTKEPIRWRVLNASSDSDLDGTADSVLLLTDSVLDIQTFNQNRADGNVYENSDLRKWLNSMEGWEGMGEPGGFLNTAFGVAEQNAISNTYIDESDDDVGLHNPFDGCDINGDKVFILSMKEMQGGQYGFLPSKCQDSNGIVTNETLRVDKTPFARTKDTRGIGFYWLRSAYTSDTMSLVGIIDYYQGSPFYNTYYVRQDTLGVAPEINLNCDSVLFSTAVGMTKSEFGVIAAEYVSDEWNVTVLDGTDFAASRKPAEVGNLLPGEKVTIEVTNIPTLTSGNEYTQISAMLINEAGTVMAYGKVSDSVATGEMEVTIPTMLSEGNYTLKVFAEDVNSSASAYATDYASNMVDITVVVVDIDSVEITDITDVVAGEAFDVTAACATTGVVETEPTVTYTAGGEAVEGIADYETEYVATITLTAVEGYAFSDTTSVTVNGKAATSVTLNDDGTLTVTYNYTTEELPEVTPGPTPEVTPEADPDEVPPTGDNTSVAMLLVLMAGALIVLVASRRRVSE